jgi:molybdenum cofactor guanylyltransferase
MLPTSTQAPVSRDALTAVILAGGRGQRMGGVDKGLVELAGRALVGHVLAAVAPQAGRVVIVANRSLEQYRALGVHVVSDSHPGYLGPLAGMLSGLEAADTAYVLTVPCDAPLVAGDLAARLGAALVESAGDVAVAHDGERLQPVFALLRRDLAPRLQRYLEDGGRKIDRWYASLTMAVADMTERADTFVNVNDTDERAAVERRLMALRR